MVCNRTHLQTILGNHTAVNGVLTELLCKRRWISSPLLVCVIASPNRLHGEFSHRGRGETSRCCRPAHNHAADARAWQPSMSSYRTWVMEGREQVTARFLLQSHTAELGCGEGAEIWGRPYQCSARSSAHSPYLRTKQTTSHVRWRYRRVRINKSTSAVPWSKNSTTNNIQNHFGK